MSTRYYCDKCDKHLTADEVNNSLDIIGKILCSEHLNDAINRIGKKIYVFRKKEMEKNES